MSVERPDPKEIHWPPTLHYDAAMEAMDGEQWRMGELQLLAGILRALMAVEERLRGIEERL